MAVMSVCHHARPLPMLEGSVFKAALGADRSGRKATLNSSEEPSVDLEDKSLQVLKKVKACGRLAGSKFHRNAQLTLQDFRLATSRRFEPCPSRHRPAGDTKTAALALPENLAGQSGVRSTSLGYRAGTPRLVTGSRPSSNTSPWRSSCDIRPKLATVFSNEPSGTRAKRPALSSHPLPGARRSFRSHDQDGVGDHCAGLCRASVRQFFTAPLRRGRLVLSEFVDRQGRR